VETKPGNSQGNAKKQGCSSAKGKHVADGVAGVMVAMKD
jgi:hypothetical protein